MLSTFVQNIEHLYKCALYIKTKGRNGAHQFVKQPNIYIGLKAAKRPTIFKIYSIGGVQFDKNTES